MIGGKLTDATAKWICRENTKGEVGSSEIRDLYGKGLYCFGDEESKRRLRRLKVKAMDAH
jgi:hypothetical protein